MTAGAATFGRGALPQRFHQVDDLRLRMLLGSFDLFATLLLLDQLLERVLVVISESFRLEMPCLGLDDMDCQIEHIPGNLLVGNFIEVIRFLAYLVGIAQRDAQHTLAARLDRDHMFPRRGYDAAKGNHASSLDRSTDYREGLPADLALRGDIVGNLPMELVDLAPRHELVDPDRVRAADRDGLKLIVGYFDVAALHDLVSLDDVLVVDRLAGDGIDLAIFDPVAGSPVDLMKFDFLPLRGRREQLDRTRDQ